MTTAQMTAEGPGLRGRLRQASSNPGQVRIFGNDKVPTISAPVQPGREQTAKLRNPKEDKMVELIP